MSGVSSGDRSSVGKTDTSQPALPTGTSKGNDTKADNALRGPSGHAHDVTSNRKGSIGSYLKRVPDQILSFLKGSDKLDDSEIPLKSLRDCHAESQKVGKESCCITPRSVRGEGGRGSLILKLAPKSEPANSEALASTPTPASATRTARPLSTPPPSRPPPEVPQTLVSPKATSNGSSAPKTARSLPTLPPSRPLPTPPRKSLSNLPMPEVPDISTPPSRRPPEVPDISTPPSRRPPEVPHTLASPVATPSSTSSMPEKKTSSSSQTVSPNVSRNSVPPSRPPPPPPLPAEDGPEKFEVLMKAADQMEQSEIKPLDEERERLVKKKDEFTERGNTDEVNKTTKEIAEIGNKISEIRKNFEKTYCNFNETKFVDYLASKAAEGTLAEPTEMTKVLSQKIENESAHKIANEVFLKSLALNKKYTTESFVSRNYQELMQYSIDLTTYTTHSVLSCKNKEDATEQITNLIDAAFILAQKGDFNSSEAILFGLQKGKIPEISEKLLATPPPIKTRRFTPFRGKMKDNPNLIPPPTQLALDRCKALTKLYEQKDNFKTLRNEMKNNPSSIPPITVLHKDCTSLFDSKGSRFVKLTTLGGSILKSRVGINDIPTPEKAGNEFFEKMTVINSPDYTITKDDIDDANKKALVEVLDNIEAKKGFGEKVTNDMKEGFKQEATKNYLVKAKNNKVDNFQYELRKTFIRKTGLILE
jgi:RasGEF domain